MRELRLRSDLAWREAGESIVALDGDLAHYLTTNATGTLLWRSLVNGATEESLVDDLIREFGLDRGDAERDVAGFIAELTANDLLER